MLCWIKPSVARLGELTDTCKRVKTEAAKRDLRARRYLRTWSNDEGMFCLSGAFAPEDGAILKAILDKATEQEFSKSSPNGSAGTH